MRPDRRRYTGFEVKRGCDGSIVESGLQKPPPQSYQDLWRGAVGPVRAVVLAVYFADDDDRPIIEGKQRQITADVRTLGRTSRTLYRVPVCQPRRGLWDEDSWVPRPSRLNLEGGDLKDGPPTPAENVDGDQVLIQFLEGDPQQPIIVPYTLGHPAAQPLNKADGRRRRIRHAGVLIEISEDGDLTIDATGAAKEELGAGGAEQSNSGTAGKITLVTKDGSGNQTSLQLDHQGKIYLGGAPGSGDEPLVLGNQLKALLTEILSALASHKHTGVTSGGAVSGPPGPPELTKFSADLPAGLPDTLSAFIFGKKEP